MSDAGRLVLNGPDRSSRAVHVTSAPDLSELAATIEVDRERLSSAASVQSVGYTSRVQAPTVTLKPYADQAAVLGWLVDADTRRWIGSFDLERHRSFTYSVAHLDDGEPCAFLAHGPKRLGALAVDPARRREGIGRAVVQAFLDLPDTEAEVYTTILNENARSLALFASLGFIETIDLHAMPGSRCFVRRQPADI